MTESRIPLPTDLEAKIGQLINVRIGSNLPPAVTADDDAERIARLLERCPIGGLTLFNGAWPSTRTTLAELQAASGIPLLVGADIERGCEQQMHGLCLLPHAGAFGAAGRRDRSDAEQLALEFGQATAAEARLAGIHVAFAPVADTNTNPRNPIIATRAFGGDPQRVAPLVAAFVRGCESSGVAAAAKHFPGHGDTQDDSHDSLPIVSRDRRSIESTELPAFRSAIEAGSSMMMTAHVAYPALDPTGTPATLSAPIVTRLLRDELGYTGVVCSDSLLMAGVRDRFASEGELCVAVLDAGVDWLLDVAEPELVLDYLASAVAQGRLDEARIDQSVSRIIALKRRLCGPLPSLADSLRVQAVTQVLAERVATAACHVEASAAPAFDPKQPVVCLLAKPFATPLDPPEQPLRQALSDQFAAVDYFELGPDASPDLLAAARQAATTSSQLVLAMIVKPAAWHRFGLLDYQQQLFAELAGRPGSAVVALGVPNVLEEFSEAMCRVCAYSDVPASQQAVAKLLAARDTADA